MPRPRIDKDVRHRHSIRRSVREAAMPRPHDAVISVPEFWRVLVLVLAGFGLALAISWSIDAVVAQQAMRAGITAAHV
jgi:hypothetical protein